MAASHRHIATGGRTPQRSGLPPPADLTVVPGTLLSPSAAASLPLLCALGLVGLALFPSVWPNPPLRWSVLGAAAALGVGTLVLFSTAASAGRRLRLDVS